MTFTRLVGGLLLIPFLIFYLLPLNVALINYGVVLIFAIFSMTDFLDGYLARKYGLESAIGRALDPIADKFLVCSALIALLAIQKIYFLWVIVLIGREICMLSLRQIAALHNIVVSVSYLGKIKSFFQMALIIILIARPLYSYASWLNNWSYLENILLVLTLYFALVSFYKYTQQFKIEYLKLI